MSKRFRVLSPVGVSWAPSAIALLLTKERAAELQRLMASEGGWQDEEMALARVIMERHGDE